MSTDQICGELEAIKADPDFSARSSALADGWKARGLGGEVVEPILRFMESHPDIDYGAPGELVHYVERFLGRGYEALLLESFLRRPTGHTAWMLNRLIHGTGDAVTRTKYVQAMEGALAHPGTDGYTLARVREFLSAE